MGCQCANKEEESKSEIMKEQNEEYEQEDNNNLNSNSKEGIFNLEESNQEQNQDKTPSQNQDNEKENENENEYQENDEIKKSQEKSNKYANYPEKMLTLINNIRADPVSYADTIEDSIQNITEEQDHNDESKTRIIYKKKVKVALNRGEIAFKDAADELRGMGPLPPLELKNEICVPLPEDEEEIKDSSYLREQVKVLREKNNIDVFFKDLIKIPEVSALLMIVDDSEKNPGKKRQAVLNKDFKYIGISSKFVGKTFIAYFSFSK
jgi:hypothetical protein